MVQTFPDQRAGCHRLCFEFMIYHDMKPTQYHTIPKGEYFVEDTGLYDLNEYLEVMVSITCTMHI